MRKPLFLLALATSLIAASCVVKESPRQEAAPAQAPAPAQAVAGMDSVVFRGVTKIDTAQTRIYIHKATDTARGIGALTYVDGYTLSTFLVDVTAGSAMPVKEILVDKAFQPLPEGTVLFDRKKFNWKTPPLKQ